MCESFFATLECELLDRCRFATTSRGPRDLLASSKVGTTCIAVTAASAIVRRSTSSGLMQKKTEGRLQASCPPPASVMVVIGDPPAGRGQLAAPRQMEENHLCKTQLLNCPPKRVTPKHRPAFRGEFEGLARVLKVSPGSKRHFLRGASVSSTIVIAVRRVKREKEP